VNVPCFVVTAGQIEILRSSGEAETLVAVHAPGQFTGEVNMISARPALFRVRARESGEAIELSREQMVALVQTDAGLGEILMRAFILRRVELIASGLGDAVLLGSAHSPGTLRIKEFLSRNGHPYSYIDLDRDADVQEMLDRFHVARLEGVHQDRSRSVTRRAGRRAVALDSPSASPRNQSTARLRCR
jgi:thioredoxin reductase (NADPH)